MRVNQRYKAYKGFTGAFSGVERNINVIPAHSENHEFSEDLKSREWSETQRITM